jgi:hypothetical protein
MADHHRTVAYTSPPTLGYLAQAGILDLVATCHNCSHVSVLAIENLIERMGPDRPLVALKTADRFAALTEVNSFLTEPDNYYTVLSYECALTTGRLRKHFLSFWYNQTKYPFEPDLL